MIWHCAYCSNGEQLHNAATEVDERTGSFDNNSNNSDMLFIENSWMF